MGLTLQLTLVIFVAVLNSFAQSKDINNGVDELDADANMGDREKRVIIPGTKWCGHGDIAESYDDLGILVKTDKCCRQHDHCDINIPAGGKKYGYRNKLTNTISHCSCDKRFKRCLKRAKDATADVVGVGYFIFVQKCFLLDNSKPRQVRGTRRITYL